MQYYEFQVTLPEQLQDAVANFLISRGVQGLIIEESTRNKAGRLIGYSPDREDLETKKQALHTYLRALNSLDGRVGHIRIACKVLPDWNWTDKFKQSFQPRIIGDFVIKPPWVKRQFPGKIEITIHPKMAFGTGEHETTQLCLMAVQQCLIPGMEVLDLGTGSGIQAIAAVKLGAQKVLAIDIDQLAVENARENCRLNRVQSKIKIEQNSFEKISRAQKFDLIIANLITKQIIDFLPRLSAQVHPGGWLVLSGILVNQQKQVLTTIRALSNLRQLACGQRNEWLCLIVQRSAIDLTGNQLLFR